MNRRAAALAVLLLAGSRTAHAEKGAPSVRLYLPQHEDENWSYLRRPQPRHDWTDPLKYIPFAVDSYVSIGGEAREYIEHYFNESWGAVPGNDVYLLQRYLLHVDVHLSRYFRTFAQLESSIETGRQGGPRPQIDENWLDVNQAWAEVALLPGATLDDRPTLAVRGGRQELYYGDGKFLSARELNVRQPFDGVRIVARLARSQIDGLFVVPVSTNRGLFDDGPNGKQRLWALYATTRLDRRGRLGLDTYYLGFQNAAGVYLRGVGAETRHTLGARFFGRGRGFDGDLEAAIQLGTFADTSILAWTAVGTAGYTLAARRTQPRFGVAVAAASGDGGGHRLGTFNALFPRGDHFGAVKTLGPANTLAAHGEVVVPLPRGFSVGGKAWTFWRESVHDGLYSIAGFPLRHTGLSPARFIGPEVQLELGWARDAHFDVHAVVAWFEAGPFFAQNSPARDTWYSALWATYRL